MVFCSVRLSAGNDHLYFKRLTIENGLSQSSVSSIIQDKYGFMWFGTQQGLNRYDGYNFKVFSPEIGKTSILSSHIFCLYTDNSGNIWIGTDVGFSIYNQQNNTFTNYQNRKNDNSSLGNDKIHYFYDDKEGNMWIGTDAGISLFNLKTKKFINYSSVLYQGVKQSIQYTYQILRASNGELGIATPFNGLFFINKNMIASHWYKYDNTTSSLANTSVQSIIYDKHQNLWIATANGLNRLDAGTGKMHTWKNDKNNKRSLSNDNVNRLTIDHKGNVWICTESGLDVYNESTNDFKIFKKEDNNTQSLNGDYTLSVFEDRQGLIWVGTYDGGITCIQQQQEAFETYSHDNTNPNSLSNNTVASFLKDKSGNLWIGTYPGGLNKLDLKTGNFKNYTYSPTDKQSLSSNSLTGITEDSEGTLWIGTMGDGINHFDPKTGKSTQFYATAKNPDFPSHGPVFDICYDKKRNCLWLATFDRGLNKMDLSSGKIQKFVHSEKNPNSISGNFILNIKEDKEGILWMATFQGLSSYNPKSNKFRNWQYNANDKFALKNNNVNGICLSGELIWLAADYGLYFFDKKTEHFRLILKQDGLADNFICSVIDDKNGNIWIGTNKGISFIKKPSEGFNSDKNQHFIIKNFNLKDGLQGNEFNGSAAYCDNDGALYFGGVNGFNIIHPDRLVSDDYLPSVYLTDFSLFNKEVSPKDETGILNKSLPFVKNINLSYKQNSFSFSFVALNYKNPEKITYKYKLEGFDNDWRLVAFDKRMATYTNLDPGIYTFRVMASSDGINWNPNEAKLKIIISPPLWGTFWFRILSIILFIILLVLLVRYVLRRKYKTLLRELEQNQQISNIRSKIARDIHDNIGAELTRISLLTEVVKMEHQEMNDKSINKLSDASREIAGQLGEIVWSVNPVHDNMESMLSYMRNYILQFLETTEIKYEINFPDEFENINIHPELRRNIFLVLKESLNNIVKYANASYIKVRFSISEGYYELVVEDDGIGLNLNVKMEGNGLINMKSRMQTVEGVFRIQSEICKGTSIFAEGKLF